jgi:hypothetical protein
MKLDFVVAVWGKREEGFVHCKAKRTDGRDM